MVGYKSCKSESQEVSESDSNISSYASSPNDENSSSKSSSWEYISSAIQRRTLGKECSNISRHFFAACSLAMPGNPSTPRYTRAPEMRKATSSVSPSSFPTALQILHPNLTAYPYSFTSSSSASSGAKISSERSAESVLRIFRVTRLSPRYLFMSHRMSSPTAFTLVTDDSFESSPLVRNACKAPRDARIRCSVLLPVLRTRPDMKDRRIDRRISSIAETLL
mmetsp:Transcript_18240/g.32693  ORF Transcript_18240/g.32693 Transcript_18240/m.32693 type:complete len:222 (+) Transcript_18240:367-1032(+)